VGFCRFRVRRRVNQIRPKVHVLDVRRGAKENKRKESRQEKGRDKEKFQKKSSIVRIYDPVRGAGEVDGPR